MDGSPSDSQKIMDGIRKIVRSLRKASKRSEKKVGLGAAQLFILQKIGESDAPLTVNELAARSLTHQSTVSVVVKKLVKRRLVLRKVSLSDARAVQLRLTPQGRALFQRQRGSIQEVLLAGIARLSLKERSGLKIGLEALLRETGIEREEAGLFFEGQEEEENATR